MVMGVKEDARKYKKFAVISACSFTWLAISTLLMQRDIYSFRVTHDAEDITSEEEDIIYQDRQAQIFVFLQGELYAMLATLKKLTLLLDYSPARSDVTIFSPLPAGWLYATLFSLAKRKSKLGDVRFARAGIACEAVMNSDFPLLERAAGGETTSGAGLSTRELDALLNYYRGRSIKLQAARCGLADKTLYTHRQHGLQKLFDIQQWLNDAAVTRQQNRRRRACGMRQERAEDQAL